MGKKKAGQQKPAIVQTSVAGRNFTPAGEAAKTTAKSAKAVVARDQELLERARELTKLQSQLDRRLKDLERAPVKAARKAELEAEFPVIAGNRRKFLEAGLSKRQAAMYRTGSYDPMKGRAQGAASLAERVEEHEHEHERQAAKMIAAYAHAIADPFSDYTSGDMDRGSEHPRFASTPAGARFLETHLTGQPTPVAGAASAIITFDPASSVATGRFYLNVYYRDQAGQPIGTEEILFLIPDVLNIADAIQFIFGAIEVTNTSAALELLGTTVAGVYPRNALPYHPAFLDATALLAMAPVSDPGQGMYKSSDTVVCTIPSPAGPMRDLQDVHNTNYGEVVENILYPSGQLPGAGFGTQDNFYCAASDPATEYTQRVEYGGWFANTDPAIASPAHVMASADVGASTVMFRHTGTKFPTGPATPALPQGATEAQLRFTMQFVNPSDVNAANAVSFTLYARDSPYLGDPPFWSSTQPVFMASDDTNNHFFEVVLDFVVDLSGHNLYELTLEIQQDDISTQALGFLPLSLQGAMCVERFIYSAPDVEQVPAFAAIVTLPQNGAAITLRAAIGAQMLPSMNPDTNPAVGQLLREDRLSLREVPLAAVDDVIKQLSYAQRYVQTAQQHAVAYQHMAHFIIPELEYRGVGDPASTASGQGAFSLADIGRFVHSAGPVLKKLLAAGEILLPGVAGEIGKAERVRKVLYSADRGDQRLIPGSRFTRRARRAGMSVSIDQGAMGGGGPAVSATPPPSPRPQEQQRQYAESDPARIVTGMWQLTEAPTSELVPESISVHPPANLVGSCSFPVVSGGADPATHQGEGDRTILVSVAPASWYANGAFSPVEYRCLLVDFEHDGEQLQSTVHFHDVIEDVSPEVLAFAAEWISGLLLTSGALQELYISMATDMPVHGLSWGAAFVASAAFPPGMGPTYVSGPAITGVIDCVEPMVATNTAKRLPVGVSQDTVVRVAIGPIAGATHKGSDTIMPAGNMTGGVSNIVVMWQPAGVVGDIPSVRVELQGGGQRRSFVSRMYPRPMSRPIRFPVETNQSNKEEGIAGTAGGPVSRQVRAVR